ncbi:hypothetical protein [Flavobacterium lipolyticum]|uniref:Uncharacterized protein n=1 Tax=Flavobacterium lipolyticum TaxID=2893754 RepID=A0ABS8M6K7_9FLAO|nr:hypothetical protein [Flavobacterium sp. F-126]MCC9020467.1 hypothetical protein [Flavobacterium sp. F-126]
MAVAITEIKNLRTSDLLSEENVKKFDNQIAYSSTIVADGIISDWISTDNIQVTWKDADKVIARAVGGRMTIDKTKYTISGLINVSNYKFGLNGEIEIGPKDKSEPAVVVSVRIGNIPSVKNPKADWIIDFSDKEDGKPGSSIKLKNLVEWIQDKTGDTEKPAYPESEKDNKPEDLSIVFKEFYFNITQNTFDFDVQTQKESDFKFGKFIIKKAGFRVTNTPVVVDTKALAE